MKKKPAFTFINELIGDYAHVMELSGNPKILYVEVAINTLHAATDVFAAYEEYKKTKRKKGTMQTIHKKNEALNRDALSNYKSEEICKLEIEYEKVKIKLQNEQFRDIEVRKFIKHVQSDLKKVLDIFQHTQIDPDYSERTKVEEVFRRTLRDYNKLLNIYIEEENEDGKD